MFTEQTSYPTDVLALSLAKIVSETKLTTLSLQLKGSKVHTKAQGVRHLFASSIINYSMWWRMRFVTEGKSEFQSLVRC